MCTWPPDSENPPADADQRRAANALLSRGRIAVEAAPGTGKTFLGVYLALCAARVGWTDRQRRALFLTFSRNARVQVEHEVLRYKESGWLSRQEEGTIEVANYHAFFLEHLRRRAGLWGCGRDLKPATLAEARGRIVGALGADPDDTSVLRGAGLSLSRMRFANDELTAEKWCPDCEVDERLRASAIAGMAEGRPSYDDFAPLFMNLLELSPGYLSWLRARYPLVVIDEFQDTDLVQYQILRLWAPSRLVLLYDRYQMIYEWRGSRAERAGAACRDFCIASEGQMELSTVHRAEGQRSLCNFIQELRQDDLVGKAVKPAKRDWLTVRPVEPSKGWPDQANQREGTARIIVGQEIGKCLGKHDSVAGLTWSNGMIADLGKRLRCEGRCKCRLISDGGVDDEAVRDLVDELRSYEEGASILPWLGRLLTLVVPAGFKYDELDLDIDKEFGRGKCPFGGRRTAGLKALSEPWTTLLGELTCGNWRGLCDGVEAVLTMAFSLVKGRAPLDPDGLYYVQALRRAASAAPADVAWAEGCDALEGAVLQASFLSLRQPIKGLHLMTIHQAKGREFDHVVIPWLPDRGNGHPFNLKKPDHRRLLYVALTRAKQHVTVIYPTYLKSAPPILDQWQLGGGEQVSGCRVSVEGKES